MTKNIITLPTSDEARDRYVKKIATPLDELICFYQPSNKYYARKFIRRLEDAIQYVIENVGAFHLTTDAPELGAIELLRQIQDDLQYDGHRISESLREKISAILKSPQVR